MIKKVLAAAIGLVAIAASGVASAGVSCGRGYVVEVAEGHNGVDHFRMKIYFTSESVDSSDLANGYVQFGESLPAERLRGIRAMAYLALANRNLVHAYSSQNTCKLATQFVVYHVTEGS